MTNTEGYSSLSFELDLTHVTRLYVWRPFVHPAGGLYFLAFLLYREQVKMEKWTMKPRVSTEQFRKQNKRNEQTKRANFDCCRRSVERSANICRSPSKEDKENESRAQKKGTNRTSRMNSGVNIRLIPFHPTEQRTNNKQDMHSHSLCHGVLIRVLVMLSTPADELRNKEKQNVDMWIHIPIGIRANEQQAQK